MSNNKIGPSDYEWLLSQALGEESKRLIRNIIEAEDKFRTEKIRQTGDNFFKVDLGGLSFWTRGFQTHSLVHQYFQIFKIREESLPDNWISGNEQTVVDIGANEGFWTLRIKEVVPNVRVIAIEPNPFAFEVLDKNVTENNINNVELFQIAISDEEGLAPFQIIKEVTALGSLEINTMRKGWLEDDMISEITVKTSTLDELTSLNGVDKIDLLKIDTEGSELLVLEGAKKVIDRTKKLEVEYHDRENRKMVIDLLSKEKFRVLGEQNISSENGTLFFSK